MVHFPLSNDILFEFLALVLTLTICDINKLSLNIQNSVVQTVSQLKHAQSINIQ